MRFTINYTSIVQLLALTLVLLQQQNSVIAQPLQNCSCTPLIYRWTLDFSKTCGTDEDINVDIGPGKGILSAECNIRVENPAFAMTEDSLVPVKVLGYQLIELGQSFERIKVYAESFGSSSPLLDGAEIEFTSETAAVVDEVSGGFVIFVTAENASGETIELQWIMLFSNLCEKDVFKPGDSVGWIVFVSDHDI